MEETRQKDSIIEDLLEVVGAAFGWIDAVPENVVDALPVMPGFDRDWAESVIYEAKSCITRKGG
jgi:hypothetical protein